MEVKKKYIVTFEKDEAEALSRVLGGISDNDFQSKFAIAGDMREAMRSLYSDLLDEEAE